ncbi:hypothetical protein SDC9_180458 [bioreactor metagenome]|uniref:Uncharacterized protein n=1 Tax=bioreactor metagenome TaxID=1076179 RepID=A0A645H1S1_9ZZZZ
MQIALYRADDDAPRGLHARFREQGLEHFDAHVHCPRGNQHLGHEDLVVLKLAADDAHAGQQAFLQNLLGGVAFLNRLRDKLLYDLRFAFLQLFGNLI